ncbi:MAG: hypothetical protein ACR2FY_03165 [Pirellulaceae bacterium]
MKRILAVAALVGLGIGFVGCGGQPAASGPSTDAEKAAETAAATETTRDETTTAAASAAVAIPADAPPDEVVTAFLEARRSGDTPTTAALLTSTARSATAKHKIDVNGEALPDLQFQVAKSKYLKNNPKGAHVSSLWTELLPDGTKASYEVVWVLRKEAAGWRVAGFAAELTPGTEPQFLNFEDPEDMIRKQQESIAAAEQAVPAEQSAETNEREQANIPTRKGETPKRR